MTVLHDGQEQSKTIEYMHMFRSYLQSASKDQACWSASTVINWRKQILGKSKGTAA
jgi:hypothetical protein